MSTARCTRYLLELLLFLLTPKSPTRPPPSTPPPHAFYVFSSNTFALLCHFFLALAKLLRKHCAYPPVAHSCRNLNPHRIGSRFQSRTTYIKPSRGPRPDPSTDYQ